MIEKSQLDFIKEASPALGKPTFVARLLDVPVDDALVALHAAHHARIGLGHGHVLQPAGSLLGHQEGLAEERVDGRHEHIGEVYVGEELGKLVGGNYLPRSVQQCQHVCKLAHKDCTGLRSRHWDTPGPSARCASQLQTDFLLPHRSWRTWLFWTRKRHRRSCGSRRKAYRPASLALPVRSSERPRVSAAALSLIPPVCVSLDQSIRCGLTRPKLWLEQGKKKS